ncbi:disease resistance protein (TIR-NBS-LRR class) [Trifolium medium]|uniref:Disease resistance protein (TIR-NBS-LRR class) n=1 Tax=Trifolium medium TaxID=97028 RepID=A0A392NQ76_9FABA|nr:disease resistance protein (TIR-NBS-LRR class) [Trifolium medium]
MVSSSPILTLTQPPPTDAEKGLSLQSIMPIKRPLEDVIGDTSKSVREDGEVYAITIQSDPPHIERCHEDDAVQLESVSSCEFQSEESTFNTKGSDSEDPFDRVGRKLSVSCLEVISPRAKSEASSSNTKCLHLDYPNNIVERKLYVNGHVTISSGAAYLGSIREAINALEMLMLKDLFEVSSDPATQLGLHQLLDAPSRRTVEVQEAIVEFKRKAVASCQDLDKIMRKSVIV